MEQGVKVQPDTFLISMEGSRQLDASAILSWETELEISIGYKALWAPGALG
jgi:hypothetical protein